MVGMFVKCKRLDYACKVFDVMPDRDATTGNAMLSGFCQSGYTDKTFSLFREMRFGDISPDSVTVMTLIQSASFEKKFESFESCARVWDTFRCRCTGYSCQYLGF